MGERLLVIFFGIRNAECLYTESKKTEDRKETQMFEALAFARGWKSVFMDCIIGRFNGDMMERYGEVMMRYICGEPTG